MDYLLHALPIGAGATLFLDLWSLARWRLAGVALPDYGLVGRWFAHMPRGRFRHEAIARAAPVAGERWLGWLAHYATGVAFAAILLGIWGLDWARHPTPGPAFAVDLGSVLAPFLLMQPGMGAGIAARRAPRPWEARRRSLVTHAVFALGLFVAAEIAAALGRLVS